MKDFLKDVFEYTFTFNDKVIELLLANHLQIPEKSLKLLNHTLNAQEIWNARIEERPCPTGVWEIRDTEKLKEINAENFRTTLQILTSINLDKTIRYKNSKGEAFTNTVQDILFHIVNHSTYHRGQIATDCKLNDISPLVSDYIFYKRDNL